MAELLPSRGIISTSNMLIDNTAGSVISATSQKNLWRMANVGDARRSKRWRSTSDGQQKVVVKLPTGTLPTVFALIDSNVAASQTVTLKQASDSSIMTSVASWTLSNTYAQSQRGVLRWYLGAADSGTANSANAYWEVTLPNNGSQSTEYHEIGTLWFGTYLEVALSSLDRSILDPSTIAISDGGARYPDTRPTYHEVTVDSTGMPEADAFTLMNAFDAAGTTRHLLVDLWAASSDATKIANGAYYATLDANVAAFSRTTPLYEDASLTLIEARA